MRHELKGVADPWASAWPPARCCAGPLLGLIGGLSLAGSAVVLGLGATLVAELLVMVAVVALVVRHRRRHQVGACSSRRFTRLPETPDVETGEWRLGDTFDWVHVQTRGWLTPAAEIVRQAKPGGAAMAPDRPERSLHRPSSSPR